MLIGQLCHMPHIGTAIYTLVGIEILWTCMVSYNKNGLNFLM